VLTSDTPISEILKSFGPFETWYKVELRRYDEEPEEKIYIRRLSNLTDTRKHQYGLYVEADRGTGSDWWWWKVKIMGVFKYSIQGQDLGDLGIGQVYGAVFAPKHYAGHLNSHGIHRISEARAVLDHLKRRDSGLHSDHNPIEAKILASPSTVVVQIDYYQEWDFPPRL